MPGKGRRSEVALISERLQLRNRSGWIWDTREPRRSVEIPTGLWTGRISRIRILASALGPALNRQAGITAARPAANLELQWQTVLTVVLHDRSFLTRTTYRELCGAARTLRLSHDLLSKLIEAC